MLLGFLCRSGLEPPSRENGKINTLLSFVFGFGGLVASVGFWFDWLSILWRGQSTVFSVGWMFLRACLVGVFGVSHSLCFEMFVGSLFFAF